MGKGQSRHAGRSARSGQFVPVERARRDPQHNTVERLPKPGFGGESSSPRGRDAGSGKFIPVDQARERPNTAVVEKVPHGSKNKK